MNFGIHSGRLLLSPRTEVGVCMWCWYLTTPPWSGSCGASRHSASYQGASLAAAFALMNYFEVHSGEAFPEHTAVRGHGSVSSWPWGGETAQHVRSVWRLPSLPPPPPRLLSGTTSATSCLCLSSPSRSVMNGVTETVGGALRRG